MAQTLFFNMIIIKADNIPGTQTRRIACGFFLPNGTQSMISVLLTEKHYSCLFLSLRWVTQCLKWWCELVKGNKESRYSKGAKLHDKVMQYLLVFDHGGAQFLLGPKVRDGDLDIKTWSNQHGCIRSEGYSSYVTLSTANRLIDAHSVILVFWEAGPATWNLSIAFIIFLLSFSLSLASLSLLSFSTSFSLSTTFFYQQSVIFSLFQSIQHEWHQHHIASGLYSTRILSSFFIFHLSFPTMSKLHSCRHSHFSAWCILKKWIWLERTLLNSSIVKHLVDQSQGEYQHMLLVMDTMRATTEWLETRWQMMLLCYDVYVARGHSCIASCIYPIQQHSHDWFLSWTLIAFELWYN